MSGPIASTPRVSTPTPAATPSAGIVAEAPPTLLPGEVCRLPIIDQGAFPWKGAFVAYPSGRLIPSAVHYIPPPTTGDLPLAAYLFSRKAWLPASRAAVSPDGSSYASEFHQILPDGHVVSQIHLVDVATGRDRTVSDGPSLALLDFEPEGLYLTGVHWGTEGSGGLWRLNPTTGVLTQLPWRDEFVRVRNGIAWANGSTFQNHQLLRRDLGTGQETVWFEDPNGLVSLAGIDSTGAALVSDANAQTPTGGRLLRVPAANDAEVVTAGSVFNGDFLARIGWSDDGERTWLSADDGIYLLKGGTIQRVFAGRAVPAGICF